MNLWGRNPNFVGSPNHQPQKDLRDMIYEGEGPLKEVENNVVDNSRWSVAHSVLFKDTSTGKHYKSCYSVGATEMQCEEAYEYDKEDIECFEVELKEVTVKQWVEV